MDLTPVMEVRANVVAAIGLRKASGHFLFSS